MHIKVNIDVLRDGLSKVLSSLDNKVGSIGNWLFLVAQKEETTEGTLFLYTSNMSTVRTLYKVTTKVERAGEVAISPKLLSSILTGLPGEGSIELACDKGTKVQVKYGKVKSELAILSDATSSKLYLKNLSFNTDPITSISVPVLVESINRTLFCAATGENAISDASLSSIYMETEEDMIRSISTNKIMAGKAEILDPLIKNGFKAALHRDGLSILKSLINKGYETVSIIPITEEGIDKEVLFRFDNVILGIRLGGRPYKVAPITNVLNVPEGYQSLSVDRKNLINVIKRLSGFAEQSDFSLSLATDKLTLLTKGHSSIFNEELSTSGEVKGITTIGLNINDIISVLSTMVSENVFIYYKDDTGHFYMIEGTENSPFRYVLSPIRLSWIKK